ncbi:hypothetical protein M378DRAFT_16539 [Amanita muscaria Koide BX008]|uniref:Uncharacterized protein n=1 Tax=Amanita muscaria (strain Koide BX008) TaxID=946122 RepID=A0A0C2SSR5_AMAMK|nr:hypothetical protein M378DRAFT_16539 [Amanita muscaria Koide BX008]
MSSTKDFADQVPIFHGSGWITWEPIMKAFLRTKGVWKYVDGSATMPTLGIIMDLDEAPTPPTIQQPVEPGPKEAESSSLAYDENLAKYKQEWKDHRAAMATWRTDNYEAHSYNHKTQADYIKAKADYDEGNDKALGYLSIKISRSVYHLLTESASESWTILKDQYSKTGAAQLYLDWIKLKELSPHVILPESLKTLILLGSLPADWQQSFQTLLLTLDPAELKMQDVLPVSTRNTRVAFPLVRLEHLGLLRLLQPWQDNLDFNKTLRLRTGKAGGVNNREGEVVEAEDVDVVVIPGPSSAPPPPQGDAGVNKHGIACKGPNTQKLPLGQKGPNYARNLQKKYQRKAMSAIQATTATGEYQGAPQAQYVTQDWQTQFPEIQFPTASTSGIQEIPEYSYPAIELDSVPTPGPSTLEARLSSVPPVPSSYLSRQSTLEPIPEGKGKGKAVDPTAKSTATDTWPTGLVRSSNGFYCQQEDINQYLQATGHDDTDAMSLGDEEDFHYDGGDYDMQD